MPPKKPSILVVTTGGTFGMLPKKGGFLRSVLKAVPEAESIARLDVATPFALDSSSLTPEHWAELARLIAGNARAYDGFVVTHGTDTMAYTASALSFMLENLGKPVVLTGAQRPLAQIRNDARSNFLDAVEVAAQGVPEVCIVFGGLVLRGNRARKWSLGDFRAFASPNFPPLGAVGTKLELHSERFRKPKGRFVLRDAFDPRVLHLRLAPGLHGSRLSGLDVSEIRGVVLEAFGAGNVPLRDDEEVFPLSRLTKSGVVVAVVSGSEHGAVDLDLYEGGRRAAESGAVSAYDMTAEAAVAKLMCALGRHSDPARVARAFAEDWAGETTPRAAPGRRRKVGRGSRAFRRPRRRLSGL